MKELITTISLVLLGVLGTIGLNQSSEACALCEEAAKKAALVMAQAAANKNTGNPAIAPNSTGQPIYGGGATVGGEGRKPNSAPVPGALINGYLDAIGRGSDSTSAPSSAPRQIYGGGVYNSEGSDATKSDNYKEERTEDLYNDVSSDSGGAEPLLAIRRKKKVLNPRRQIKNSAEQGAWSEGLSPFLSSRSMLVSTSFEQGLRR